MHFWLHYLSILSRISKRYTLLMRCIHCKMPPLVETRVQTIQPFIHKGFVFVVLLLVLHSVHGHPRIVEPLRASIEGMQRVVQQSGLASFFPRLHGHKLCNTRSKLWIDFDHLGFSCVYQSLSTEVLFHSALIGMWPGLEPTTSRAATEPTCQH